MAEAIADHAELKPVTGGELEVRRGGAGQSLLLLHGSYGWWGWEDVHDRLAEQFDVIAPSHPGFGRSTRLPGIDTVDDLAYFYLDLLAEMRLAPARIVGFGLGGWIATEMAVRCPHAVERLVLVDSVGIKVSDRETRDIADPFIVSGPALQEMLWRDPEAHQVPVPGPTLEPELLEAMLHNLESAMYYGWKPYMHNPKLRHRLHRIASPTLVVWGDDDRIVPPVYGRAFAQSIPGARFVQIADSGHYPYREQVEDFVPVVVDFLNA
jgi:pimeloyl-ACP methyl ester carboxylesterase